MPQEEIEDNMELKVDRNVEIGENAQTEALGLLSLDLYHQ